MRTRIKNTDKDLHAELMEVISLYRSGDRNYKQVIHELKKKKAEGISVTHPAILSSKNESYLDIILDNTSDFNKDDLYLIDGLSDMVDWANKSNGEYVSTLHSSVESRALEYNDDVSALQNLADKKRWNAFYLAVSEQPESALTLKQGNMIDAYVVTASRGDREQMNKFLSLGIDPTSKNLNGETALAVYIDKAKVFDPEVFKQLVKDCKDQLENEHEFVDFLNSINDKGDSVMTRLFKRMQRTQREARKNPALLEERAQLDVAFEQLIDMGVDPDLTNKNEENLLFYAVVNKVDNSVIEKLVERGADLNKRSADSHTPLSRAIADSNGRLADKLIDLGARIHFKERYMNHNPIFVAIQKQNWRFVEKLIDKGVDVNISNIEHDRHTPLIYAIKQGNVEAIKMLSENGADLKKANGHRWTPAMYAAQNYIDTLDTEKNREAHEVLHLLMQKEAMHSDEMTMEKFFDILHPENIYSSTNFNEIPEIRIQRYKDKIQNLADSVRFTLNNNMREEYLGHEAAEKIALETKGKESTLESEDHLIRQANHHKKEKIKQRETDAKEGLKLLGDLVMKNKTFFVTAAGTIGYGAINEKGAEFLNTVMTYAGDNYMLAGAVVAGFVYEAYRKIPEKNIAKIKTAFSFYAEKSIAKLHEAKAFMNRTVIDSLQKVASFFKGADRRLNDLEQGHDMAFQEALRENKERSAHAMTEQQNEAPNMNQADAIYNAINNPNTMGMLARASKDSGFMKEYEKVIRFINEYSSGKDITIIPSSDELSSMVTSLMLKTFTEVKENATQIENMMINDNYANKLSTSNEASNRNNREDRVNSFVNKIANEKIMEW